MLACYMSLSDELADEICTLENNKIFDKVEEIFSELASELKNLIAFYKESFEKQQNILISIC